MPTHDPDLYLFCALCVCVCVCVCVFVCVCLCHFCVCTMLLIVSHMLLTGKQDDATLRVKRKGLEVYKILKAAEQAKQKVKS